MDWLKARLTAPKPSQAERRSAPRQRMEFDAEIRNADETTPATGIDIHEDGAKILCREAYHTGAVIFLTLKDVQLGGFAEVRHCTRRKDGKYAIGLAFRGPLVPQGAVWQIQRVHPAQKPWTQVDDKPPVVPVIEQRPEPPAKAGSEDAGRSMEPCGQPLIRRSRSRLVGR